MFTKEELQAIKPETLAKYVTDAGWFKHRRYRENSDIYRHLHVKKVEIIVPNSDHLADYTDVVRKLISTFSSIADVTDTSIYLYLMRIQKEAKHVHKMHPIWAAFWYTYIFTFVALNLSAAALEPWTWYIVYAAFLPPELVGAAIKTKFKGKIVGDTLSESLWAFAQHGLARKMFVGMFGIVLLSRLWTLFDITAAYAGFADYHYMLRLPWDALIIGACLWLPLHLYDLGKQG